MAHSLQRQRIAQEVYNRLGPKQNHPTHPVHRQTGNNVNPHNEKKKKIKYPEAQQAAVLVDGFSARLTHIGNSDSSRAFNIGETLSKGRILLRQREREDSRRLRPLSQRVRSDSMTAVQGGREERQRLRRQRSSQDEIGRCRGKKEAAQTLARLRSWKGEGSRRSREELGLAGVFPLVLGARRKAVKVEIRQRPSTIGVGENKRARAELGFGGKTRTSLGLREIENERREAAELRRRGFEQGLSSS